MSGNIQLVEYGLSTEVSDWRAHVSFRTHRVYCYRTELARQMSLDEYAKVPVRTNGIVTAIGYLIPPRDVPGLRVAKIPDDLLVEYWCEPEDDQSKKGVCAASVVEHMIRRGLMCYVIDLNSESDVRKQYAGIDLTATVHIQVKCDYQAGPKAWNGSGNLFVQIAECNPNSRH